MKYAKETAIVLLGIGIYFLVSLSSLFITDRIFFEKGRVEQLEKMLKEPSFPKPDSAHPNIKIYMPKTKFTWSSGGFFALFPSFFWFIFGRIARAHNVRGKWFICIITPVVSSFILGHIFLPFYLFFCYLGARNTGK
jgi:hypothetical protein